MVLSRARVHARAVLGGVLAVSLVACSLVTSLDGLSGGAGGDDGGGGGGEAGTISDAALPGTDAIAESAPPADAEPDVAPPATCASAATQCVTAAPAGWTGPFSIYDGTPANAPAACPSPQVNVLAATADASNAAASCTTCSCAASNVACPPQVTAQSYGDPACSNATGCAKNTVLANSCVPHVTTCGGSVTFAAPIATATCTPSGGAPNNAPPAWTREVLGCKAPASALVRVDCSADQVCAPKPAAPFEGKMCVLQAGDVPCPAAPYVSKRLLHESHPDTRGCSACACQTPTTPCTGGLVYTGPSSQCSPQNVNNQPFGSCFALGGLQGPNWLVSVAPPLVTCPASGGAPTGGIGDASPVTACCM